MEQRNGLCQFCTELGVTSAAFWDPPAGSNEQRSQSIGQRRFGDIKASETCPMCRLICQTLVWKDGTSPAHDRTINYARVLYGRYFLQNTHASTKRNVGSGPGAPCLPIKKTYRLRVSTGHQYGSMLEEDERAFLTREYERLSLTPHEGDIMLLKKEGSPEELFHGRKMGDRLNFPLVRRWISTHHSECNPKDELHVRGAATYPLRVIDTRRLVVSQTPPNCRYAALSYTWGPNNYRQLRLRKENERRLTNQPGLKAVWEKIPRTIRNAIDLCCELKIDYLWVDALCRGQGAGYKDEKVNEHITLIFAKALVTIVGDGHCSWSGLKGVQLSRSRHRRQVRQPVGDLTFAVAKPLIDQSMNGSGWMERTWTHDEWKVSRHVLVLARDQAFFSCKAKKMIYSEDTYSETALSASDVDTPEIDDFWSLYEGWDGGFDVYASQAEHYASRHVTNEDDLSAAFAAVKRELRERLGMQYHGDLPVAYFAQALCFVVIDGKRRSSAKFPSWSWQGWNVSGRSGLWYKSTSPGC
ncbi:predicted protein [Aspergillus terreus NIH2624]|uniref:Heterokaryon incompatibility domain-containing protein n=1 Tax=Aspergillus terreus (strain NIH 2624 / FGSC A1156) TaxID=341663 RepID=Q0CHY6_ASPTN|nr:uncharacterized protein ATEG_06698 [Aspergillus terreus NIH2624]EAU33242.1 predicted protein [Aspergillus terreus NIH2624]